MAVRCPPIVPNVRARVERVLALHEGGELAAMTAEFATALTERGTAPSRFELIVHIPMAFRPRAHGRKAELAAAVVPALDLAELAMVERSEAGRMQPGSTS